MASHKSTSPRRREVRRQVTRPSARWRPHQKHQRFGWALLLGAALALVGAIIALSAEDRPHYQLGQIIEKPIVPRVTFIAEDKEATQTRRQEIQRNVPPHYSPNQALLETLRSGFDKLMALATQDVQQIKGEAADQLRLNEYTLEALRRHVNNGEPTKDWQQMEQTYLTKLFTKVVLTPKQYEQATDHPVIRIQPPLPDDADFQKHYQTMWLQVSDAGELHDLIKQYVTVLPRPVQETVHALTMQAISPGDVDSAQPTYRFDPELTERIRQQEIEGVAVTRTYTPEDVMVPAGKQLSESDLYLIDAERAQFETQQTVAARWMNGLGMLGLFAAVAAGLWAYNFAYNDKLVRNPMRGLALTGLLLLMQLLAALMSQAQPEFIFFTATLPTLLAVVVLTITYDRRYGLGVGAIHALIVLLTLDLELALALALVTGVAVAVAQLQEIRTRSKLVLAGMWTGLAMGAVTVLAAGTLRPLHIDFAFERLLGDGGWAVLAGVSTGLLVQGVLPGIERLFKVTTAMTLKELNDASHPLLQRLAQEAPGTYQHSLRIADMAESSAEAIGADGLLCRVGAMYHDIGKINKPQYFIENQGGGPNRHSKLSPAMSLLIIVGHVKDGIEMAREYGLPPVLRHFIESHHGSTLVEYFYHAARRQQEAEAKPGPSEFEFRYPGPKPQTKEAAILLLCDSIEGAARSLDEPTPVRLDQVVHNMANKRLMDGQFDECNLTLKELARIEQAITKTLCAIYHGRVKYPGGEEGARPLSGELAAPPQRRSAAS
jgi:putative nucleotidyltransferase with HDIG domain